MCPVRSVTYVSGRSHSGIDTVTARPTKEILLKVWAGWERQRQSDDDNRAKLKPHATPASFSPTSLCPRGSTRPSG
jgi:hypothetical protein